MPGALVRAPEAEESTWQPTKCIPFGYAYATGRKPSREPNFDYSYEIADLHGIGLPATGGSMGLL